MSTATNINGKVATAIEVKKADAGSKCALIVTTEPCTRSLTIAEEYFSRHGIMAVDIMALNRSELPF